VFFWVEVEENAPITNTTAESLPASFEFTDITQEWILFQLINGQADTSPVTGWDAFKRLSRGPGEGYDPSPLVCGGHRV
jgi:hypothetical protein